MRPRSLAGFALRNTSESAFRSWLIASGALLMSTSTKSRMPRAHGTKMAAVPGVAAASPQLYLGSLANATCCTVPRMLIVAYDSPTDFTLKPWAEKRLGRDLAKREASRSAARRAASSPS